MSTPPPPSLPSRNEAKLVPAKTLDSHHNRVICVAWFPDDRKIVSAGDGELRIWDTQTGLQVGEAVSAHGMCLLALDVSSDGTMIVGGGLDRIVSLWDSETGELIHTCKIHKDALRDVRFSPDSKRVASCSNDRIIQFLDVETGELAFRPVECEDGVCAICYSSGGDRIASASSSIQIWDISEGSVDLILTIEQSVFSLAWTHDGEHIVGGGHGVVTIWSTSSGEETRSWQAHEDWIRLSLSPTTTHLATCSWDRQTFVFDIETGEQIAEYEHDENVRSVTYSPSGEFMATACCDRKVYVWEDSQSSWSLGSSMLDLPATIRSEGVYDQVDLPAMLQLQPTNQAAGQHRKTLGGIHGIFRRHCGSQDNDNRPPEPSARNQSTGILRNVLSRRHLSFPFRSQRNQFAAAFGHNTSSDKNEGIQEDKTPEGNWIAEARTRPIYAFETGPLPDEVERGCFFHLASYICYGRRDPNVAVPSHYIPTHAPSSAPGIPHFTFGTIATHSNAFVPVPVTTNVAITEKGSQSLSSARIRALLDRLFSYLRSRLHYSINLSPSSGTHGAVPSSDSPLSPSITGPIAPVVVVTGPLPETVSQPSGTTVTPQASSPLSLSTTPTVLASNDVAPSSPSAEPVVEPLDTISEESRHDICMSKFACQDLLPPSVPMHAQSPGSDRYDASNTTLDPSPLPEVVDTLVLGPSYCDCGSYSNDSSTYQAGWGSDAQPRRTGGFEDGSDLFENPWADSPLPTRRPSCSKGASRYPLTHAW